MDAPQSPEDVQPVVSELRRSLDTRLDILWNPTAVITKRGEYDALGHLKAPVYDGRWEVVCYESGAQTATWRPYQRVCLLTQPAKDSVRGVPALTEKGPYAPVGPWVVDYLRAIDQANAANLRAMRAKLDADEAMQEASAQREEDAGVEESAGRVWDNAHREGGVAVFHPVNVDLRAPLTR